jgi:hypothetical protein
LWIVSALATGGDPLSRVCEPFAERADPVGAALKALASWFEEGWVASVRAGT